MKNQLQKILLLCVAVQVCGINLLFAQSDNATASPEAQYKKGKAQYEQGNYSAAIQTLRPLSREGSNAYTEYASLFFALSALETGDYSLARNMLKQIQTKYPQWDKMEEVQFWLTNTYFREGDYEEGMKLEKGIQESNQISNRTKKDAAEMKEYFLSTTTQDSVLQSLLKVYPKDKMIAEKLVNLISRSFYDTNKQLLLDSLVKAYNLDLGELGILSQQASVKKDAYRVSVMLPFLYEKLSTELKQQSNQFVLDLYKGMKLAAHDLEEEGINIQLNAYDTKRSYDETASLLEKEELQNTDVIIGPLYPGPFKAVTEFSKENQVYMFNPLSNNPQVIGENPYSYLIQPSIITEAKVAAQFALDSLPNSHALIITGNSHDDSLRFNSFVSNFQQDSSLSIEILQRRSFNRESMDELTDTLKAMTEGIEDSTFIYIASDNELLISNFFSAAVMSGVDVPVIGNETWLQIRSISVDQLNELNVYLLDPGFTNFENEKLSDFVSRYRHEMYDLPNKYVLTGYDMVYYIGQMLNQNGIYFQEFYSENQKVPSLFYSGYNYYKANDNQEIPIIKFDNNDLMIVKE